MTPAISGRPQGPQLSLFPPVQIRELNGGRDAVTYTTADSLMIKSPFTPSRVAWRPIGKVALL